MKKNRYQLSLQDEKAIQAEYMLGTATYRYLAEKYEVSFMKITEVIHSNPMTKEMASFKQEVLIYRR